MRFTTYTTLNWEGDDTATGMCGTSVLAELEYVLGMVYRGGEGEGKDNKIYYR